MFMLATVVMVLAINAVWDSEVFCHCIRFPALLLPLLRVALRAPVVIEQVPPRLRILGLLAIRC